MGKIHELFVKDGRIKITIVAAVSLAFIVVALIYFFNYSGSKTESKPLPPHAKNQLIVKFKEKADGKLKKEKEISGADIGIASVTSLNQKEKVKKIKKIIPPEAGGVKADKEKRKDLERIYVLEFEEEKDTQEMISQYSRDQNVEYAEANYAVSTQLAPNDPYYYSKGTWGQSYDDLWGVKKINSASAWDQTTGSRNVVVAVIDTGIDYNHSDLAANVWHNTGEVPNNGQDDDSNGFIDDYYGFDFWNYDGDPFDDHAHGTHCAGTIGAVGNNSLGVVGVNWQVSIMGVKFLNSGGSGYISDAVSSTIYAVDNGAKVLSNSWGGGGRSSSMQTAINYAHNNGAVFVAAAGNSNSDAYNYTPAGLDNVMTIAATDYRDQKASFSSWGDVVEFAAPGVDVLSLKSSGGYCTTVGGNYCRMSGTSMATPHAAGVAALVVANTPGLSPDDVLNAMISGADDLGDPGKDIYFGYGRVNAAFSLTPVTHVDGTLIRANGQTQVFLLEGGQKRSIPNPEVFISWFYWADIVVVYPNELDEYELGSDLSLRPGSLIKIKNDPAVYAIDGTSKRLIPSASVFLELGYDWADIDVVGSAEMDKYPPGDDIPQTGTHLNGTLIKTASNPAVYLLEAGQARLVPNVEVFTSRYLWGDIVTISEDEMNSYTKGDRLGFRPGSLARDRNQPAVYAITDTAKRPISSAAVFSWLGYNWNRIIVTSASELDNYTTGPNL